MRNAQCGMLNGCELSTLNGCIFRGAVLSTFLVLPMVTSAHPAKAYAVQLRIINAPALEKPARTLPMSAIDPRNPEVVS